MRRLLVLIGLLGLAACGGGDVPAPTGPQAIVAAAIKTSEESESARMTFRMSSDLGAEGFTLSGEGIAAMDNSRGRVTGQIEQGGRPDAIETIWIGDDNWYGGEAFAEMLPGGKRWLYSEEETPTSMSPSEFVDFLRESEGVKEVGREDVRGQRSVHLRGPVDVEELAENTSSAAVQQLSKMPQASELRMVVDVWVGEEDDRMHRIGVGITHPDTPGELSMTADILEWDVSLDAVKPPPDEQVLDEDEVPGLD